jgi:hypothetical protein
MRVRYQHRTGQDMTVRDYNVLTQDRPRGRWTAAGWVSGFGSGPGGWAALGTGASAWTAYRTSRGEAVRDMLAGRTYLSPEGGAR